MINARMIAVFLVVLPLLAGCDVFVSTNTRIHRAETAMNDNDYGRAIVELRNVVQAEPNNLQARSKLVEALLLNGDLRAVDVQIAQLTKLAANDVHVQELMARVYIAKRDFQRLLDAFDQGKMHLEQRDEGVRRAQALLGLRKTAEAGALLQQVLTDHANDAEALLLFAQSQAAGGAPDQALATIDKLLITAPQDARAWAAKGYLHAQQGSTAQAVQALANANRNAGGRLTRMEELSTLALLVEQQLAGGNVKAAQAAQKQLSGFFPNSPMALLAAGEVSFAQANYTDTVANIQKLLTAQPELPAARMLLARALVFQGNDRQAESELQRLVSALPQNMPARVLLGQVEIKLGMYVQALQVLAPVLFAGGDQQTVMLVTQAQIAVAKSSKDLSDLTAAVNREPGNEALRVVTASTLLRAGQTQQALELLRDVRQAKFSNRRVPLLLKAVAVQTNMGSARNEAERIAAEHPREPTYLNAIASFFIGEKDFDSAKIWLERALAATNTADAGGMDQADPAIVRANMQLSLMQQLVAIDLASGRKAEALNRAAGYRNTHDKDIGAILLEADLQMQLRNFDNAIAAYTAANQLKPQGRIVVKLAKAKQAAGRDMPFQDLIQWVERYPGDVQTRMALADAYMAQKKPSAAIGEYEKVVDAQPVNVMALNNLAWLYQQQGDKRAESTARKAHELAPALPMVADTLGWVLFSNNRASEALPILADAAERAPQQADIQFHYAAALAKNGKTTEARDRLKALLANPNGFESRSEAERMLTQLMADAR